MKRRGPRDPAPGAALGRTHDAPTPAKTHQWRAPWPQQLVRIRIAGFMFKAAHSDHEIAS